MSLQYISNIKAIFKRHYVRLPEDIDSSPQNTNSTLRIRFSHNNLNFILSSNSVRNYLAISDNNNNSSGKNLDTWIELSNEIHNTSNRQVRTRLAKPLYKVGMGHGYFRVRVLPIIEDLFRVMEKHKNLFFLSCEGNKNIFLVPLGHTYQTSNYMNQDWYQNLLQKYTEYCQSDSKSDIADRHYQEQARLHGLKFIVR